MPPRIILNTVEGWGKTTLAAYAPKPAVVMAKGETGYLTLLGRRRVPDIPRIQVDTWNQLLELMANLKDDPRGIETLSLDAAGGFEYLCHEQVCATEFGGDWGEKGFTSYQKGFDVSIPHWLKLLVALDAIRDAHSISIILLSHCKIKPFKNPLGDDFDRYVADCHDKTWGVTHKWADAVFFAKFRTVTEKKKGEQAKGIGGGTDRVLYAERNDAYDAKNRYGMDRVIEFPADPSLMWSTLDGAINENNQKGGQ